MLKDCKMRHQEHFICCQGGKLFLPKDCYRFCHKLSCQNLVLSCENFSLCIYQNFSFKVLLLFKLSFVAVWVLSKIVFGVLSQFRFFKVLSQFEFLNFVPIEYLNTPILNFWVLSQFKLNFVTHWFLLVKKVCCSKKIC